MSFFRFLAFAGKNEAVSDDTNGGVMVNCSWTLVAASLDLDLKI